MLLTDRHYDRCKQSLLNGDEDAAFCAVHALKGICINLDIQTLARSSSALTDVLRPESRDMDKVPAAFSTLQSSYLDTMDALKELESA